MVDEGLANWEFARFDDTGQSFFVVVVDDSGWRLRFSKLIRKEIVGEEQFTLPEKKPTVPRSVTGQADDVQTAEDIQRVVILKPMIDGRWLISDKGGSDVLKKATEIAKSFVVVKPVDKVLIFFRGVYLAAREFLQLRNVQRVIKMTM